MLLKTSRVQKSIGRLRKFLKKKPKNPAPEKIHDVRTSTRRLESSLQTIDLGKKKSKKRLERDLAAVRKRLGKVRDMDVLTAQAMSIGPKTPEPECLVELLEYLGAKRSGYVNKLRKTAKRYGPRLRRELADLAKKFDGVPSRPGAKREPVLESNGQAATSLDELMAALDQPARLNRKNLHPYRLKVKELRYVLQLSKDNRAQEFVDKLGQAKDAIGEWHDWQELLSIATEVVDGGAHSKLARQFKTIADEKFQKALSVTNHMRKTYASVKRQHLLAS